jgi:hypothetical protein
MDKKESEKKKDMKERADVIIREKDPNGVKKAVLGKLKRMSPDEQEKYKSDVLREAKACVEEGDYDIARQAYDALGMLEEAKDAAQKGGDFYAKKDSQLSQYLYQHAQIYGKLIKDGKSKSNDSSLEDKVHLLGIIGASFLASLIFFSENITGNVISNSALRPGNAIGLGLFVLGIIAALFYLRKK